MDSTTSLGGLVVTASGAVGFPGITKGATNRRALLAHIDGTTISVLRDGDPAPGFPAGVFVSLVGDFSMAMSDAGMVISAPTTSDERGIWLHDFRTITRLPSPVTGCLLGSGVSVFINQSGMVTLRTKGFKGSQSCTPPSSSVFKWQDGQWRVVLDQDSLLPGGGKTVPNMMQTEFSVRNDLNLHPLMSMIDDQGNVAFFTDLKNHTAVSKEKTSLWYKREGEEPKLILLAGETLPGDPKLMMVIFFLTLAA